MIYSITTTGLTVELMKFNVYIELLSEVSHPIVNFGVKLNFYVAAFVTYHVNWV